MYRFKNSPATRANNFEWMKVIFKSVSELYNSGKTSLSLEKLDAPINVDAVPKIVQPGVRNRKKNKNRARTAQKEYINTHMQYHSTPPLYNIRGSFIY